MHIDVTGSGPTVVLVHGSAADADTWSIQKRTLARRLTLVAYDRFGATRSPVPSGHTAYSVEEHAADLGQVIERHAGGAAVVCGSSFGSVVALELARTQPDRVRGLVMIEPPMGPADGRPVGDGSFRAEFDRRFAERGGPAAAEYFLRSVLGDEPVDRMPAAWRERACAQYEQIRLDADALMAYRPRYAELSTLATPVLLCGGARSAHLFGPTLDSLERALPITRRETFAAGHMLHAEAFRRFNETLVEFAAEFAD